jgi:hypothetical protein
VATGPVTRQRGVGARPASTAGQRAAFFVAAMLIAFVGFAVILEVGLRVVLPQPEAERWFESNPRYGHTLKKSFHQTVRYPTAGVEVDVRTNSLGLRGGEIDLARTDLVRILLVGDSFTFGEGLNVDEIFATKLARRLNQKGERVMVINAGVGGWGTLQATRFARDHFGDFQPDVVVYTFCGNDPDDDAEFLQGRIDNERGRLWFPGKVFLRDRSHLYRFLYYRVATLLHVRRQRAKQRRDPSIAVDPQSATLISDEQWGRTVEAIMAFGREFRAWNPDGLFLVQATYPVNPRTRVQLGKLDDGAAVRYVDLHDDVLRIGLARVRLPYDGHWTAEMHTASAEDLAAAIEVSGVMKRGRIPRVARHAS